jgi:two-component system phosphate regulon sensor histidine kinase PhoR
MSWRFIFFLICQSVGGLAGWYFVPPAIAMIGALSGVVLGGIGWLCIDISRSVRLLRWLRVGDTSDVAMRTGLWGEVSDRVRRLIRASEQKTREGQNRLQNFLAAFQASPNGVVLLDSEGRIEWFNQTASIHFGLDDPRDLLQHFGNLVRDPGYASYFSGQDFHSRFVMQGRASVPERPVKLSVQLHTYSEGRLLLLSRDITAVEQAEAMRRDFVANVSHEIRTPLTVLGGFVETLQTLTLTELERERYLALMAEQAQRMQILVSDLLTLSKLEGSPLPGSVDWTSMTSLMRQLEQEGRSLSAVMNHPPNPVHSFLFELPQDIDISGAGKELFSAMSNLVGNAVRYTPPGRSISVRAHLLPDGRLEFSVQDAGEGIAPEHIPRLTERFYRVDRSRSRETGGTGLGLAIVKHVAQRHDAELKITSVLGKGSVFSMVFPAHRIRHSSRVTSPDRGN